MKMAVPGAVTEVVLGVLLWIVCGRRLLRDYPCIFPARLPPVAAQFSGLEDQKTRVG